MNKVVELMQSKNELVFVCSAYSGDIANNTRRAKKICRKLAKLNYIPFAPHLYFPRFLDENNASERKRGIGFGVEIMRRCAFVICVGEITEGMRTELEAAQSMKIPTLVFRDYKDFIGLSPQNTIALLHSGVEHLRSKGYTGGSQSE